MSSNIFYNPKSAAAKAKKESEKLMAKNYEVFPELPLIIRKDMRSQKEFGDRALILDAFLHIHFNAPTDMVAEWISKHDLEGALTEPEKAILNKSNADLSEEEKVRVFWYIESLWALLWAGRRINKITVNKPCEDFMAGLCPNIIEGESDKKIRKLRLRTLRQIFFCLDIHYRLNHYAQTVEDPKVNPLIVQARCKALDWLLSPESDWESINLDFDS